ncbi:MAG: formylglycine-generating enzyme family protein [Thermodesulfobacteriota bacterium]|nr:formylglycine-generating enzyme family protein [Thermodesulfobacteriota bacterium]
MKALVSRADLLAYLVDHKDVDLRSIADCFGFDRTMPPSRRTPDIPQKTVQAKPAKAEEPRRRESRPRERFYYLSSIQPSELVPEVRQGRTLELPDWFQDKSLPPLDVPALKQSDAEPPDQQPLTAWEKIWPVLSRILGENTRSKQPDISRLVKLVANGHFSARIPYQQHTGWTATAWVLLDFPERLKLFGHDYQALIKSLKKMRGETGLHVRQIKDYPGGKVMMGTGKNRKIMPWKMPAPGEPVLILGDAGLLDVSPATHEQWLKFGERLKAAGCVVYLLTPLPARYLSAKLVSLFRCICWYRDSNLRVITGANDEKNAEKAMRSDRDKVAGTLLPWLSAGLLIEPELLRSVCRLLSLHKEEAYDAGVEALCWTGADVERSSLGFRFHHDKIVQYREQLARLARDNPKLACRVYTLFKRHHSHREPFEFAQEVDVLVNTGAIEKDALADRVEIFWKQRVKALAAQSDTMSALRHCCYYVLQRQTRQAKTRQGISSSLWAILHKQLKRDEPMPKWLNLEMAAPFLNQRLESADWLAVQRGEQLYLATRPMLDKGQKNGLKLHSTPLYSFSSPVSLLVEERRNKQEQWDRFDRQLDPENGLWLPLLTGQRRIHANGRVYTLSELVLPSWASGIGRDEQGLFVEIHWLGLIHRLYWQNPTTEAEGRWEGDGPAGVDEYGLYGDLEVKGVTQRFRWCEPGTFLMGSPEDEPERYDDETLHEVTLTRGFWLADTTVTQELWQAVMGENPSEFKGADRPVEQVSWEDVQRLMEKLNKLVPELSARLPWEAEWEYGCRAGTTTPFSFGGNIMTDQVNYNGNYPYNKSEKGAYREQTVEVKSLPCNNWGLYEMHANVWEWCRDYHQDDLSDKPVVDPHGPETGEFRVVRGGSWISFGGFVRSAFRYWNDPAARSRNLGFRMARGH